MATPNVDNEIVRMIAADTNTPEETVCRMFEETWAEFSEGASWTVGLRGPACTG